jgi:hypothetical protein
MNEKKLEALKAFGDMTISAREIADAREAVQKGILKCELCKEICKWIILKAVGLGTCAAGAAGLTAIFALADIVFVEADEILVPLEAVVEVAWEATCEEVGIVLLGKEADKYAKLWCQKAKIC